MFGTGPGKFDSRATAETFGAKSSLTPLMSSFVQSFSRFPSEIAKKAWRLMQETFAVWSDRQAPRLGAAVALYAIFQLPRWS